MIDSKALRYQASTDSLLLHDNCEADSYIVDLPLNAHGFYVYRSLSVLHHSCP